MEITKEQILMHKNNKYYSNESTNRILGIVNHINTNEEIVKSITKIYMMKCKFGIMKILEILFKTFCITQSFLTLIKGKSILLIFGTLMVMK